MKRIKMLAAVLPLSLALFACQGQGESKSSGTDTAKEGSAKAEDGSKAEGKDKKEVIKINWARDNSGNAFQELAMEKGWFKDEGIEITQKPFDASNDATTALLSGNIDIFSNYGTNGPLQTLAAGEDLQIVGGYMATGCMPIITTTTGKG